MAKYQNELEAAKAATAAPVEAASLQSILQDVTNAEAAVLAAEKAVAKAQKWQEAAQVKLNKENDKLEEARELLTSTRKQAAQVFEENDNEEDHVVGDAAKAWSKLRTFLARSPIWKDEHATCKGFEGWLLPVLSKLAKAEEVYNMACDDEGSDSDGFGSAKDEGSDEYCAGRRERSKRRRARRERDSARESARSPARAVGRGRSKVGRAWRAAFDLPGSAAAAAMVAMAEK